MDDIDRKGARRQTRTGAEQLVPDMRLSSPLMMNGKLRAWAAMSGIPRPEALYQQVSGTQFRLLNRTHLYMP